MPWSRERRWALIRLLLGVGQIGGAGFSLALLLSVGLTSISLAAVVVTGLLTTVSVLLFGARVPPTAGRRKR
jgi:hypothetical protein